MLDVTTEAAEIIAATCRQRSAPEGGYRILRRTNEGEAEGLRVAFAEQPEPGDEVIHEGDANVFVAPEARPLVDGWTLSVRRGEQRPQLVLERA
jgi:Fe-S cluster assembly iron-binding protein IscA